MQTSVQAAIRLAKHGIGCDLTEPIVDPTIDAVVSGKIARTVRNLQFLLQQT